MPEQNVAVKKPMLLIDDGSGDGMQVIADLSEDMDIAKANIAAYVEVVLEQLQSSKHGQVESLHFKRWDMSEEEIEQLPER